MFRDPADYKWCSWAEAMAGDEHARDMYRFIYEGVADEWIEIVKLHKAAIHARIGEIDETAANGGIRSILCRRSRSRRCSVTGFCARGAGVLRERQLGIYSETYTEGSDPFDVCQKWPGKRIFKI